VSAQLNTPTVFILPYYFYLIFQLTMKPSVMDELPGEVLLLVMSFCGAAELAALAATSCGLASLALDDPLWRRLFATCFFEPPPPLEPQYLPPSALSTRCFSSTKKGEEEDEKEVEEEEKEVQENFWTSLLRQQPKLPDDARGPWPLHDRPVVISRLAGMPTPL
jgi:hypothetical protein